jgi:hypothetical protein
LKIYDTFGFEDFDTPQKPKQKVYNRTMQLLHNSLAEANIFKVLAHFNSIEPFKDKIVGNAVKFLLLMDNTVSENSSREETER